MSFGTRLLQLTVVLLALACALQAEESPTCSNATLHGSYGLRATGTEPGGEPFTAVGRFTFDGAGHLTGRLFVSVGGNNITPPVFHGTYFVYPHCIVTDFWGAPINSTHVSVIVDNAKGYFILNNTSGSGETISGEAKKQ